MRKSRTQRRNKSKRKQKSNKNNKKASRRNHTIKKMRGGRRLGPDHQNQSRPVQKCLQDLADYWWNSEDKSVGSSTGQKGFYFSLRKRNAPSNRNYDGLPTHVHIYACTHFEGTDDVPPFTRYYYTLKHNGINIPFDKLIKSHGKEWCHPRSQFRDVSVDSDFLQFRSGFGFPPHIKKNPCYFDAYAHRQDYGPADTTDYSQQITSEAADVLFGLCRLVREYPDETHVSTANYAYH
jgi:hypothetical protein